MARLSKAWNFSYGVWRIRIGEIVGMPGQLWWPGNERQLENEVRRLVASVRGKTISEEHIDSSIRSSEKTKGSTVASALTDPGMEKAAEAPPRSLKSLPDAVEALEHRMIGEALREFGGNKQKAAQALGLSRQGLIKKLKRLGM
jgi:DNA-binding NtrC family response regulator